MCSDYKIPDTDTLADRSGTTMPWVYLTSSTDSVTESDLITVLLSLLAIAVVAVAALAVFLLVVVFRRRQNSPTSSSSSLASHHTFAYSQRATKSM